MKVEVQMQEMSNELLINAYWSAVALNLCQDFINLIKAELARRGIDLKPKE